MNNIHFLAAYGGGTGSPIQARQTAPILLIIIIVAIIAAILAAIVFVMKKISLYYKSEKYIAKEMERPTKKADIQKLAKANNFSNAEANMLWTVAKITESKNITYKIKSNMDVNDLFRDAYFRLKERDYFNDKNLAVFFALLFKLEAMVAQTKKISSSRQFPVDSIIFYIAPDGEQFPFTINKNTKDFFSAELPDFMQKMPNKPKILERSRFTYKTKDGLSYNFITRLIRYETTNDGKTLMIISHTDQLASQAQRHFKRDFIKEDCIFGPVQFNPKGESPEEKYFLTDKKYQGKITNISAGGCCIQTPLPIKEKQYLNVEIPIYNFNERLVGIIRKTRRLQNGHFALHVQFVDLPLSAMNKINIAVYKYDL